MKKMYNNVLGRHTIAQGKCFGRGDNCCNKTRNINKSGITSPDKGK